MRLQAASPVNLNVGGATVYSLMQWHHVVATVSGTIGKVYLDGNLDGTGDVGNVPPNALDIFIGRAHPANGGGVIEWFNGIIDDIRIYDRALSDLEIQQLYSLSVMPPSLQMQEDGANLILTWPLSAQNFSLQTTTHLAAPNSWTTLTNVPAIVNLQNTVTNPVSNGMRFYRLKQ